MAGKDQDYYRRRLAQENAAAQSTSCAYARDVHLDLAERYLAKLRLLEVLSREAGYSEPRQETAPVSFARRTQLR